MQYVAVSGGKDSVAMALWMHERGEEFELLYSDSGAELPEVYFTIPRLARYLNRPLNVTNGNTFFAWMVAHDWMLPNQSVRWCTRVLKATPQDAWLAAVGNAENVCIGIRADEPRRLKKWPTQGWDIRHPLNEAGMGKQDVLDMCNKHGLLCPVYEWRTSVSCFCCPFQTVADWRNMLRFHPTLYKVAEEWEEQSYALGKYGWSEAWTLRQVREARDAQLGMFEEPDAEPCLICSL